MVNIKQLKHRQALPETNNFLALCFLGLLLFASLDTLLLIVVSMRLNAVADRRPTMAQLVNGQTLFVSEQDRNFRYPEVIKGVVKTWLGLTFNWDSKIPGSSTQDAGISVGDSKKIPTGAYYASLLMEASFGKASLVKIADIVPAEVFTGQARAVVLIDYVSEPRQVGVGLWDVDVVATRLVVAPGQSDERIPFNRTFRIQRTEISASPLGQMDSPFVQKVYELRSAGLEIEKISEYTPAQS